DSAAFGGQDVAGGLAGFFNYWTIFGKVSEAEGGHAALFLADQFAGAAEREISFGNGEAVGGLLENAKALARFAGFWIGDQNAVGLVDAAARPPSNRGKVREH